MISNSPSFSDEAKVQLFEFHQGKWIEIAIGWVHLDTEKKLLNIYFGTGFSPSSFPLFMNSLFSESHSCLQMNFSNFTNIQCDESDERILYLWYGTNPLSLSFLEKKYCATILSNLNDFVEKIDAKKDQEEKDEILPFLKMCSENTPQLSETLFRNVDLFEVLLNSMMALFQIDDTEKKNQSFHIIKNAIRVSHQKIIEIIIKDKFFQFVLKCLRLNPFNDKQFDYYQEYKKSIKIHNILQINDPAIMEAYTDNAKLKFLKDFVVCMFIEFETERIFQNIICINNVIILEKIGASEPILNDLIKLSKENPIQYLNTFSELWDIFKMTTFDIQFKDIKENFKNQFISHNLHQSAIQCFKTIVEGEYDVSGRFYEKFIEGLTQFLNHEWNFSQTWILQLASEVNLGEILVSLITKAKDESVLLSVLYFVRNLIEPAENRPHSSCRFIQYMFNSFVSKIYKQFQKSVGRIEKYVNFIMKLYKTEVIRCRRVLVENGLVFRLEKMKRNKYILISIVKMLQTFVEAGDDQMIFYLDFHKCFEDLREQYLRNKNCQNVTYSCFLSLFKSIQASKDRDIQRYVLKIFLNEALEEEHKNS